MSVKEEIKILELNSLPDQKSDSILGTSIWVPCLNFLVESILCPFRGKFFRVESKNGNI